MSDKMCYLCVKHPPNKGCFTKHPDWVWDFPTKEDMELA